MDSLYDCTQANQFWCTALMWVSGAPLLALGLLERSRLHKTSCKTECAYVLAPSRKKECHDMFPCWSPFLSNKKRATLANRPKKKRPRRAVYGVVLRVLTSKPKAQPPKGQDDQNNCNASAHCSALHVKAIANPIARMPAINASGLFS